MSTFHEQVDYEQLPQGFDRSAVDLDLVNPCTDKLRAHYEQHLDFRLSVLVPIRTDDMHATSWSCIGYERGTRIGERVELMAEPFDREWVHTYLPANFLGDAHDSWIPGAYYLDYDPGRNRANNCQISVDTPRGRVAVTHYGQFREGRVQEHCQLARERLEMLYQDETFLREIYGDGIPLKREPRGYRSTTTITSLTRKNVRR
ncbi:hypothetical protein C1Y63_09065 [Corynebacterium sp. 13CS0277]|uniref:hypothetical protein n=1 Tax=Corynebacterium sp. 13CS0277 TaxID=2071994 RepID=UPI000D48BE6F|nr:hypothetical protein [Corynebacterium sp. 13CS0277]PRQ10883.1 hypothetical protein C1Y63_09065 [Corynebacterium sp. 13CS0277]